MPYMYMNSLLFVQDALIDFVQCRPDKEKKYYKQPRTWYCADFVTLPCRRYLITKPGGLDVLAQPWASSPVAGRLAQESLVEVEEEATNDKAGTRWLRRQAGGGGGWVLAASAGNR